MEKKTTVTKFLNTFTGPFFFQNQSFYIGTIPETILVTKQHIILLILQKHHYDFYGLFRKMSRFQRRTKPFIMCPAGFLSTVNVTLILLDTSALDALFAKVQSLQTEVPVLGVSMADGGVSNASPPGEMIVSGDRSWGAKLQPLNTVVEVGCVFTGFNSPAETKSVCVSEDTQSSVMEKSFRAPFCKDLGKSVAAEVGCSPAWGCRVTNSFNDIITASTNI